MKYRIIKKGNKYVIQQRVLFFWINNYFGVGKKENFMASFDSQREAEDCLKFWENNWKNKKAKPEVVKIVKFIRE